MAKAELGTKRVCPETERKFYDLNRDPIISPYTGQSYPLTFFEKPEDEPVEEVKKEDETAEAAVEPTTPELDEDGDVEIVSLEDADDEEHASDRPARPLSAAHVPFEIESGSHGVHQAKPANEGGH